MKPGNDAAMDEALLRKNINWSVQGRNQLKFSGDKMIATCCFVFCFTYQLKTIIGAFKKFLHSYVAVSSAHHILL